MANRSELSSVFDQQLATKPRKWGKVANLNGTLSHQTNVETGVRKGAFFIPSRRRAINAIGLSLYKAVKRRSKNA